MRKENIRIKYKDTQLFKENHTSVANRVRGNFKRTEICEYFGEVCFLDQKRRRVICL